MSYNHLTTEERACLQFYYVQGLSLREIRNVSTISREIRRNYCFRIKGVTAKINHYSNRIYNRFGYCVLGVQVESGTQDGQLDNNK